MAQPLGQGWGARLLLARAAAYVKEPGRYADVLELGTVRPLLTEPPFVRALDELVADQEHCVAECIDWTPSDVMAAVQAGKIRLGLGVLPTSTARQESGEPIAWGLMPMPGSAEVYQFSDHAWETLPLPRTVPTLGIAGRVAGVVRGTRRQKAAWNVLIQLSGKAKGSDICSQGKAATPFRISQLAQAGRWLPEGLDDRIVTDFSQSIRTMLTASATLVVPRIPRAHDYLVALDSAVRQAALGEKTSQGALQAAAEAWEKITDAVGRPQQAENLMRHYGLSP